MLSSESQLLEVFLTVLEYVCLCIEADDERTFAVVIQVIINADVDRDS